MKILLLADASSPHTIKWANALEKEGQDIVLFTLADYSKDQYSKNIIILNMDLPASIRAGKTSPFTKLYYLRYIFMLRKYIAQYKPDVLHAHYASSYGLLGALSGFHPLIISAWGSDIFEFPRKSFVLELLLRYNLLIADKILVTSNYLANETKKYTTKDLSIIPFGIDTEKFKPMTVKSLFPGKPLVIGTVKSLEPIYGIDSLILAFKQIKTKFPEIKLKLLIVGGGSEAENLNQLVKNLGLQKEIVFTGFISYSTVEYYHNMIDIYVAFSVEESFGVSVLEASSCSKPVIVSTAGGFLEVVDDTKTGMIVEKLNINKLSETLETLIIHPHLRKTLGDNGRAKVMLQFNWNDCVSKLINIYNSFK